jgi:hypothetical protein
MKVNENDYNLHTLYLNILQRKNHIKAAHLKFSVSTWIIVFNSVTGRQKGFFWRLEFFEMSLSDILLSFLKHKLGKASDSEPTESEIDHLSKLISVKLLNMTNAESPYYS